MKANVDHSLDFPAMNTKLPQPNGESKRMKKVIDNTFNASFSKKQQNGMLHRTLERKGNMEKAS